MFEILPNYRRGEGQSDLGLRVEGERSFQTH